MKLFLDGITRNTDNPVVIAELKKCGYQVVKDEPAEVVSIAEIYALCDKAGVKPEDLILKGENSTLAEVKAAIKVAKGR
jgi:hypothetical protein